MARRMLPTKILSWMPNYIRIDENKHLIFARGAIDPKTKRYIGRPLSKSKGTEKPVASDSLLFDYKTKKGKIWNPASEQEGNFISGGQAKRLNETEVAYRNVIFSTCDLPFPDTHFGIVITKGIGQKNRIISGPAYLEIAGVPLPLAIPFGFFPKPRFTHIGCYTANLWARMQNLVFICVTLVITLALMIILMLPLWPPCIQKGRMS
jgi:hypothetical protein